MTLGFHGEKKFIIRLIISGMCHHSLTDILRTVTRTEMCSCQVRMFAADLSYSW